MFIAFSNVFTWFHLLPDGRKSAAFGFWQPEGDMQRGKTIKILVIGETGTEGSKVVRSLLSRKQEIPALTRSECLTKLLGRPLLKFENFAVKTTGKWRS
jgi:hypothetical protein